MSVSNTALNETASGGSGKIPVKRYSLLLSGKLLRLFVQIAVLMLYARQLSLNDYGVYQSAWLYINIISSISLFGIPSLLLSNPGGNIKIWIRNNRPLFYSLLLVLNVLPLAYIYFANEYSPGVKLLIILITVVQNIVIVFESINIKQENEKAVFISNIVFSVGFFLCHAVLLYTGYSLLYLFGGLLLVFVIKCGMLIFTQKNKAINAAEGNFDQTGRQWLFLGLNDMLAVAAVWLDKVVIFLLLTSSQFAIYFNGAYEIPVFGLMLSAAGNIMVVDLAKNATDPEKLKALLHSSTQLLAAVVFPAFCYLLFNYDTFFTFIFSEKYIASLPVFFISIFILPVRILYCTAALQVRHKSNVILAGAVIDIVAAVIFMCILYPLFGMPGLALAFVISTYIQAAYYMHQTAILYQKPVSYFIPFKMLMFSLCISAIFAAAAFFLCRNMPYPYTLLMPAAACAASAVFLIYRYQKKAKTLKE